MCWSCTRFSYHRQCNLFVHMASRHFYTRIRGLDFSIVLGKNCFASSCPFLFITDLKTFYYPIYCDRKYTACFWRNSKCVAKILSKDIDEIVFIFFENPERFSWGSVVVSFRMGNICAACRLFQILSLKSCSSDRTFVNCTTCFGLAMASGGISAGSRK